MEPKIPQQKTGAKSDTESEIIFDTEPEAIAHYQLVLQRFLDVSNWELIAGEEKASFQLCDSSGNEKFGKPKVGDYFRIKIPGLSHPSGDGCDWVHVEVVEKQENTYEESAYIRVRPAADPKSDSNEISHFFCDKATSNFIVGRTGKRVFAEVHGRNEEPNTEDLTVSEKVRNFLVAVGGMIAGSKFQWKSLTEGLIKAE